MQDQTIVCKYSCHLCGLYHVNVNVPVRQDEDVVTWMKEVAIVALSRDHSRRSPECHPRLLSDIVIPIEGADKIGGAAVN